MAIIIETSKPKTLLSKIKKAIDEKEIDTWRYDDDGDFYHYPPQWSCKAWLRPFMLDAKLVLGIFPPRDQVITTDVYAIYHGRFVEMLLAHFDSDCDKVITTPMPLAKFDTINLRNEK